MKNKKPQDKKSSPKRTPVEPLRISEELQKEIDQRQSSVQTRKTSMGAVLVSKGEEGESDEAARELKNLTKKIDASQSLKSNNSQLSEAVPSKNDQDELEDEEPEEEQEEEQDEGQDEDQYEEEEDGNSPLFNYDEVLKKNPIKGSEQSEELKNVFAVKRDTKRYNRVYEKSKQPTSTKKLPRLIAELQPYIDPRDLKKKTTPKVAVDERPFNVRAMDEAKDFND